MAGICKREGNIKREVVAPSLFCEGIAR